MEKTSADRCALCKSRSSGLICSLRPRAGARFEPDKASHVFRRGQPIFFAGTPVQALYVVHSGRVKVFRTSPSGEEQVLRLLGPGELLGYRPLLANEAYRASAVAVEDSDVCIIPTAAVRDLLRTHPDLAIEMLAKLARELRMSEDLMMNLLHRPVRERAAGLLLMLLEDNRGAADPATLLSEHLRRQDMARMIGTTPETFSRVLRSFAQGGIINLSRDSIRITDPLRLRKGAGERDPE
jgi:CRP/FNR family transcriptional regulator